MRKPDGEMWQVDGEKDCALTWGDLTDTANAMKKWRRCEIFSVNSDIL